jgi:hypothetical protein
VKGKSAVIVPKMFVATVKKIIRLGYQKPGMSENLHEGKNR